MQALGVLLRLRRRFKAAVLRGAVAGKHVDELAFGFGDDALVLLLGNLKRLSAQKCARWAERGAQLRAHTSARSQHLLCLLIRDGACRLAAAPAQARSSGALVNLQKLAQRGQLRRTRLLQRLLQVSAGGSAAQRLSAGNGTRARTSPALSSAPPGTRGRSCAERRLMKLIHSGAITPAGETKRRALQTRACRRTVRKISWGGGKRTRDRGPAWA